MLPELLLGLCGPLPGQSMARRSRRRLETPNLEAAGADTDPPVLRRRWREVEIEVVDDNDGAYEGAAAAGGCRRGVGRAAREGRGRQWRRGAVE